jgi:Tfp pilus assembly protein PilN
MMRRIDLLPSVYAEKRRERRNIGLVMLAGLAVLALLLFYWVILGSRIDSANEELADVEARNQQLQAQITRLQQFADLELEVAQKRTALAAVTALDVDWPTVLTELALVTPTDVWFTGMQGSRAGSEGETPAPTETAEVRIAKTSPSGRITFTGQALSMPAVAKLLVRLEEVRGVTAVYLQNAVEGEGQQGDEGGGTTRLVTFDSSIELTQNVLSDRFGEEGSK